MLVPVLVRANYKVESSVTLVLENLVSGNLPLLFPEAYLFNRTPEPNSLTVTGVRSWSYMNQSDPDFDGLVNQPLFTSIAMSNSFSVGNGQTTKLVGLDDSLFPVGYGVSTTLTLSNAGPNAVSWVSLVLKGMIDSSVRPDPLAVVNI